MDENFNQFLSKGLIVIIFCCFLFWVISWMNPVSAISWYLAIFVSNIITCSNKKFSGHNKIWSAQKIFGVIAPQCPPWLRRWWRVWSSTKRNAISGVDSKSHLSWSQFEKDFWVECLMSLYVGFFILALFCVNTWSLVD